MCGRCRAAPDGGVSLPKKAAHTSLFPSPSSACRASAPTSKSCRLPSLAASLEDSHFWKSLLCHRSPRPSAAYHWGPSGSAHLPLAHLPTFRMVLLPTKRTRLGQRPRHCPMVWAQTEARRNKVSFKDFQLRRQRNPTVKLNKVCLRVLKKQAMFSEAGGEGEGDNIYSVSSRYRA